MPEYITEQIRIERRTYFKGRFKGKFLGYLDLPKSDIKTENFYDLEILSGEMSVKKADFRIWKDGDEFEEFIEVERFLTSLPNPMPCKVSYEDGTTKHFNLNIYEAKLVNYRLTDQLYEDEKLFATINGEISGYLKHYDYEEVEKEIPDPPDLPVPPELPEILTPPITPEISAPQVSNKFKDLPNTISKSVKIDYANRRMKFRATTNSDSWAEGCIAALGVLFLGLVIIFFSIVIIGMFGGIPAPTSEVIISPVTSDVLSLIVIGSILFIFVKIQSKLSYIWTWIFRFIMVIFLLLVALNALAA